MLQVEVRGPLSTITGRKLVIKRRIDNVNDLMVYLSKRFLKRAEEKGLSSILRNFFSHNLIIVNGIEISALNGSNTKIKSGDKVVILNIVHGG